MDALSSGEGAASVGLSWAGVAHEPSSCNRVADSFASPSFCVSCSFSVCAVPLLSVCLLPPGHHHCAHSIRDENFFRSRTLNERSQTARTMAASGAFGFGGLGGPGVPQAVTPLATAAQGIYPRHGTGQFVIPYYRRDSKGFRRTFTQPEHVDDAYTARSDVMSLAQSGYSLAHPQSRPTYAAAKASAGMGATFVTSYRNSGLYDSVNAAQTSRVTKQVADVLQQAKTRERLEAERGEFERSMRASQMLDGSNPFRNQYAAAQQQQQAAPAAASSPDNSYGYYTNDVRDAPPPGAELYDSDAGYVSNLQGVADTKRALAGDALLDDPLDNAYRKSRTVYKRAYGYSQ